MRDFFINSLEMLINILVVLMVIGVVIAAGVIMFDRSGGILPALAVLFGGAIYIILVGGMLFLFLGIYQNTKRTAAAVEAINET
jgi:hypothetical protein